ncbi:hypothetical protein TNCT_410311 [Trichonephila clavata]|uniref:Uncharacterized protein n=1 Tax=Trichonephila clavata TaxID=2740835 RepID=A0A8X6KTK6_TRICU|nr:hypothetical protein TNCT_410311 [Trichonephila clavata]
MYMYSNSGRNEAYLPGTGVILDHVGGSPEQRPAIALGSDISQPSFDINLSPNTERYHSVSLAELGSKPTRDDESWSIFLSMRAARWYCCEYLEPLITTLLDEKMKITLTEQFVFPADRNMFNASDMRNLDIA